MERQRVIDLYRKAKEIFMREYPDQKLLIMYDMDTVLLSKYGDCLRRGNQVRLRISKVFWQNTDNEDDVWNTIVHELCHAFNRKNDGHGYYWRCVAEHMSVVCHTEVKRLSEDKISLGAQRKEKAVCSLTCTGCGRVYYFFKRGTAYRTEGDGYWCRCGCHKLTFEKLR